MVLWSSSEQCNDPKDSDLGSNLPNRPFPKRYDERQSETPDRYRPRPNIIDDPVHRPGPNEAVVDDPVHRPGRHEAIVNDRSKSTSRYYTVRAPNVKESSQNSETWNVRVDKIAKVDGSYGHRRQSETAAVNRDARRGGFDLKPWSTQKPRPPAKTCILAAKFWTRCQLAGTRGGRLCL